MNKINNKKMNSICIPHGTVAKSFNKYDDIYKKSIAMSVFSGDSKFFAVQSKICRDFLKTNSIEGKPVITGNLIFSHYKKKKNTKKNIIIASTQKDFYNMQLLGVEMFYEVYDNLIFFNKLASKIDYNFIIKLHPTEHKNISNLKNLFPNLFFSKKNINELLRDAFVVISYSSTVVEDSLNCQVPVILFDPWNRYQHCVAEKNINKKNKAVYYLSKKEFFQTLLNTIKNSNKFNFNKYIYKKNPRDNFNKLLNNFLWKFW